MPVPGAASSRQGVAENATGWLMADGRKSYPIKKKKKKHSHD